MAKLTPKPENFFFLSRNTNNSHSPFFNHQTLHLFPPKRTLKFRVLCSVKEKENLKESQKVPEVLTGLQIDELEQKQKQKISISDSGNGEVGFDWKNVPPRYKLIATTSLAFVICNMDKVNLSIAIIPMSHQYGWNASVAGLVQSSFFWGYALSQLPGGWLAKIFGGRKVLEIGVLTWSLATALVPAVAGFMPGLIFSRILVGIGEGVSPSAATDLIARHGLLLLMLI